ncbi:Importin subunit beta-3 [Candida viswanathii]|uniref:Importin subunit beta-3 n=1 Tax=Candida viswanathii TaxID=5486 RepID=A0A367XQK4_9ASCO|nr:Importin subunit beta-3 [Candida viswanathii]
MITAKATQDISLLEEEDAEELKLNEEWDVINLSGKWIGVHTAALDEKVTAMDLLRTYAIQLKEDFQPWVKEIAETIALPGLGFYLHDGVRGSAALTLASLLRCSIAATGNNSTETLSLWSKICTHIAEVLGTEPVPELLVAYYTALVESINTMPTNMVEIHDRIKVRDNDEDEYTEDVEEDEEEYTDEELLDEINKAISAIFKNVKSNFLESFQQLAPTVSLFINDENTTLNFVVYMFLGVIASSLTSPHAGIRQASSYAVGMAAQFGGDAYAEFCLSCLEPMFKMAVVPDARADENVHATENAVAAIAKVCRRFASAVPNLPAVIEQWITLLPITQDETAAPFAYMFLSELIDSNHPSVTKQIPKVVDSVIQALAHASIAGNTAQKIVASTRALLGTIPHADAVALLQRNPADLDVVQNGSNSTQTSDGSQRHSTKRRSLNTIESSVTRLLVSTKHLLESLTQWARQEADDKYVSDAYVKLGNDFRTAIRAFGNNGIDTSDIGNVPQALRIILEAALGEAPSQENLDKFLPGIRNIIVTLLQTLKSKQAKAKAIAQERASREISIAADSGNNLNNHNGSGRCASRRASKRFSAYQYAKLTNYNNTANTVPKITNENQAVRNSIILEKEEEEVAASAHPPKTDGSRTAESETVEDYILLRINSRTKKANVTFPVTFASLRLLFVEKFAYSPGSGNFPDIYIQDPGSGTLLCLNESESQDRGLNELDSKLEDLKKRIESMSTDIISQVKDSLASIEVPAAAAAAAATRKDLIKLERDFRTIKQLHNSSSSAFKETIAAVVQDLRKFQEIGLEVSQNSNRAYMEACNSKLSDDSDLLITKVDDLQDVMEEMRKDVAQRGVRVSDKQLKHIVKDIKSAKDSLHDMSSYIAKERPVWKKIWEPNWTRLAGDIKKIEETFGLIEQCSVEQTKGVSSKRNKIVANLYIPEPGESLHDAKDAVLSDIAALTPNHESRVEAIERAEKIREKEREMMRLNKFQEELGDFVEDNKLKKSGGIEELEKSRKMKDSEN